jgi:hypothetical protein
MEQGRHLDPAGLRIGRLRKAVAGKLRMLIAGERWLNGKY